MPQRYFDRFPLELIELPEGWRADDLDDLPTAARWLATHRGEHAYVVGRDLWKRCLQAYYAAISYVGEQVGRVLDALERGVSRQHDRGAGGPQRIPRGCEEPLVEILAQRAGVRGAGAWGGMRMRGTIKRYADTIDVWRTAAETGRGPLAWLRSR